MTDVDQPAGGFECAGPSSDELVVNNTISLGNLYTDRSKSESGCTLPANGHTVWFGSYFCDQGSESEYTITLSYDTADVSTLPRKGSPELKQVFDDVVAMLKTLHLKPPIQISKLSPDSGPAGTTVTVYGSGFNAPDYSTAVVFEDFPNDWMPSPVIAADRKSLTFQVPTSIGTISCQTGRIDVGEFCIPTPANHVDFNDCPPTKSGATNFCGIPIPPATYQISVTLEGSGVSSNAVPFTVTEGKPSTVSISLLYPNDLVSDGDTITVRGSGFTSSDNTIQIGAAVVKNIPSPNGTTIVFQAPALSRSSFLTGIFTYQASVSNANGQSNSISFNYR